MNLKTVTIADLEPHPQNPNTHPVKQIDALGDSLDEFDQVKNVVIWRGQILAGHGLVTAALKSGRLTLDAVDVSHWDEAKATAFMLADIRTPGMAIVDDQILVEALRAFDEPLDIPGFDKDFLKGLPGFVPEPPPESSAPPIDRAEELQEKWQCETGQIWQIESKANPGHYHRLICGDCRDMATVETLTEGERVNGVFTSPPYAMQRAKQYGGVEVEDYVLWWEKVQANMGYCLAEDGSFFVNIKPHCKDGQRVLYVFDLVLAMVRRWGWRFVDELCWTHQGFPGGYSNRFKNRFEPIYHFCSSNSIKFNKYAVSQELKESYDRNKQRWGKGYRLPETESGMTNAFNTTSNMWELDQALPGNVVEINTTSTEAKGMQAAVFPSKLSTFFIKAYSDPMDIWLDPFAGSGTVGIAAENEGRLSRLIEQLPKYCAVILERFQAHTNIQPELIK